MYFSFFETSTSTWTRVKGTLPGETYSWRYGSVRLLASDDVDTLYLTSTDEASPTLYRVNLNADQLSFTITTIPITAPGISDPSSVPIWSSITSRNAVVDKERQLLYFAVRSLLSLAPKPLLAQN